MRLNMHRALVIALFLLMPNSAYSVSSPSEWETLEPMTVPKTEVVAVSLAQKIYVIGGLDSTGQAVRTVEVFDTRSKEWGTIAPLPIPLHHTAAAVFAGKIYVLGGASGLGSRPVPTLFVYDSISDLWSRGQDMPTPRLALTAQFIDGLLYGIGGVGRNGILDVNEAYDPSTDSWTQRAPMPTPREHLASGVAAGKLYVIGGRVASLSRNLDVNEEYDPESDTWTKRASMPSPRGGISASSIAGSIFVFGGEEEFGTLATTEEYIVLQDEWRGRESMPTSRHGLGSAVGNGRIYVIGGGPLPGGSYSGINEVFSPSLHSESITLTKFVDINGPVGLAWDGERFIASWRDDGTSALVTITPDGIVSPFSESFRGGHEVYLKASPGLGGFKNDSIFLSTYFYNIIELDAEGNILRNVSRPYPFDPVVFFTFDTVGSWNFSMLATTEDGSVWTIDPEGNHKRIIVLGQRTWLEGITVAPRDFGQIGGDMILAVEEGEKVIAISPLGENRVLEVAQFPGELPEKIEVVPPSKDLFISLVDRDEIVKIDRNDLVDYVGALLLITEGRNNTYGSINIISPSQDGFHVLTLFKEFNVHFEDAIFVDLTNGDSVDDEVNDSLIANGSTTVPSRSFLNQRFAIPLLAGIGIAAFLIYMRRRGNR